MGRRKSLNAACHCGKKWDKVFNASVKLLHNLQNERQILGEKIKSLNGVIYQMKMEQNVESSKAELMLGLKEKNNFVYKHHYENACNELDDFKELFEHLSEKDPNITSNDVDNKGKEPKNKSLQEELRKLRSEIEKYKLERNSEITALLAEKNFMENDLTEQLRTKDDEVERANEKVRLLVDRAEELQLSNEKLRTDFTKMESEAIRKSGEISRLLKEIELLKAVRPGSPSSHREGKNSTPDGTVVKPEDKESGCAHNFKKRSHAKLPAHKSTRGKAPRKQFIEKGSSCSKRKLSDVITLLDTPKLFSSSFKVPKLKRTI